jgi:hypothetical protein
LLKQTFVDGRWMKYGYGVLMDWYWRVKRSGGKKSCSDVTLSTTNFIWTSPVLNPGLKLNTAKLCWHETSWCLYQVVFVWNVLMFIPRCVGLKNLDVCTKLCWPETS